jgi:hypothetical protein
LSVTLPALPFDVPPKPMELTAPPSSRVLAIKKIDASLVSDDGGDYIDATRCEGVPMGKRKDWVIPEPNAE